jgi:hypothetical protein
MAKKIVVKPVTTKKVIKKAPPVKVVKKAPPKKIPKKVKRRYGVFLLEDESISDEVTYKIGDKLKHYPASPKDRYVNVTIIGIYTDGNIIKYLLNTGIYTDANRLEKP